MYVCLTKSNLLFKIDNFLVKRKICNFKHICINFAMMCESVLIVVHRCLKRILQHWCISLFMNNFTSFNHQRFDINKWNKIHVIVFIYQISQLPPICGAPPPPITHNQIIVYFVIKASNLDCSMYIIWSSLSDIGALKFHP